MADFSLRDAWWLQPKGQDNPLPALELGVRMSQYKSSMLLKEKELANDIARTEILRKEQEAKQRIQTMLAAGNAEMATAISQVTDWTDEEQVSRVWETGSRNPMTVGGKAWLGAQHMYESARTAKRLEEESKSRITSRDARTELDAAKFELQELLNDSRIDLNDARILDLQNDIAFAERRAKIQEGNLELRREELSQKGKRLSLRSQRMYDNELKALNNEEAAAVKNATGDEAKRLRMNFNLRRRALTNKYYGDASDLPTITSPITVAPPVQREGLKTEDRTTNAPPIVVAPMPAIKADLVKDQIYETPRGRAKWDGEKFIPQ
jgi:hypothetical protein